MKPEIPCLFINYDEVLADPVELARFLSLRLIGKPLEESMAERVALFCAPGSYKSIEEFLWTKFAKSPGPLQAHMVALTKHQQTQNIAP